jgi:cobalt/nickel transport system permease protein
MKQIKHNNLNLFRITKRGTYLLILLLIPSPGFSMHIAEGFLPVKWAIIWNIIFIPFLYFGIQKVNKLVREKAKVKLLYAVIAAFVFVLSSIKLPSVAGSSSHLTGIALGAILFGASSMSVIGVIVLLFQALLLAHGGITTLGANAFSMAVSGSFMAVWTYSLISKLKAPQWLSIFVAAIFSDMIIYICTSFQLALAFQTETSGLLENAIKFLSVFAITQLPLAIVEGFFTVFAFRLIMKYNRDDIFTINPKLNV